jgi:hypothetical protein
MRRGLFVAFALVLSLGLVAPVAGAGPSRSGHQPVLPLERISRTDTQSLNWSGYAVYKDTGATFMQFKAVSGSWTQPEATCGRRMTLAAFFVGIDGYSLADPSSTTVEQIGTDVDCFQGNAIHYGWYEMYPAPPVYLDTGDYPVAPGDVMTAEVQWNSGSNFTLTLDNDCGCGAWPFEVTLNAPVTPQRTTAEWIAEMPATGGHFWPLTDFGSVAFSGASATNDANHTDDIDTSTWDHDRIDLVKRGRPFNPTVIACTGPLTSGGSSFTVYHGDCP